MAIHAAGVRLAAGHLRLADRYYSTKNAVPLDESRLVLNTRSSNALDFALLVQDLVPLLAAYEHAWRTGDGQTRLELADAICQGISPDPDLFVNRVELLGAYSMIEPLFVTTDGDGQAVYTPMGRRHVQLLRITRGCSVACRHRWRGLFTLQAGRGRLFPIRSPLRVLIRSRGAHGVQDVAARCRDALRAGRCLRGG
jgi:hypothetical protein